MWYLNFSRQLAKSLQRWCGKGGVGETNGIENMKTGGIKIIRNKGKVENRLCYLAEEVEA